MPKNEVIETYKGVKIRKYNTISIRISSYEMKKFIDKRLEGESARKAIGILCRCSSEPVIIKNNYANGHK